MKKPSARRTSKLLPIRSGVFTLVNDPSVGPHRVELRVDLIGLLEWHAGEAIRTKAKRITRAGGAIVITATEEPS
jgi:hypothetical protein